MSSNTEALRDYVEQQIRLHTANDRRHPENFDSYLEVTLDCIMQLILQHEFTLKAEYEEKIREARIDEAINAATLYDETQSYGGEFLKEQQVRIIQLTNLTKDTK